MSIVEHFQHRKIICNSHLPSFARNAEFFLEFFWLQNNSEIPAFVLPTKVSGHDNNYLFDKKKVVLFLSDMKFCFFKRLASALEETMSVARLHLGKPERLLIGASRKQSQEVSSSGGSSLEFWTLNRATFFI
jgi:hypothetical protein